MSRGASSSAARGRVALARLPALPRWKTRASWSYPRNHWDGLEVKERLKYPGDNRSINFYPIKLLDRSHPFELKMLPKDREAFFGKENIVGLSGSAYNPDPVHVSKPHVKEPAFWFESPPEVGMEFCHCYDIERIVCFTVGNGWLPICGLYQHIPGAYGCMTRETLGE